jgi:hypothetical protein
VGDPQFVPPTIHGGHEAWHVLVISDPSDPEERWLFHSPECPMVIRTGQGLRVDYECQVGCEISNNGYAGIFDRDGTELRRGTWLIRSIVVKLHGGDWTEYDQEWEIIRLVDGEYDPPIVCQHCNGDGYTVEAQAVCGEGCTACDGGGCAEPVQVRCRCQKPAPAPIQPGDEPF